MEGLVAIISFIGITCFGSEKLNIRRNVAPVWTASCIVFILYAFAITGYLQVGLMGSYIVGGIMFLLMVKDWRNLRQQIVILLMVGLISVYIYFVTRGSLNAAWDDFSHWFRMAKAVYYDNNLPTTLDIHFRTYVPGTALWIYYVTKGIGFSSANCFFAQNVLSVMCLLSIFGGLDFVTKESDVLKKTMKAGIVLLMSVCLLAVTCGVFELQVDTVIPLFALVLFNSIENDGSLVEILPIIGMLILVKNTSILFAIILVVYLINSKKLISKKVVYGFASGVIVLIYLVAWNIRGKMVYGEMFNESSQSISLRRYLQLLGENKDNLIVIIKNFFQKLFVSNSEEYAILWISICTYIIYYIILKRNINISYVKIVKKRNILMGVTGILYILFLLLTYILSMSPNEAKSLAGFDRYIGSVIVFVVGIIFYTILQITPYDMWRREGIIIGYIFMLLLVHSDNIGFLLGQKYWKPESPAYSIELNKQLHSLVQERTKYTEENVLVITSGGVNSYMSYITETYLRNIHVYSIDVSNLTTELEVLKNNNIRIDTLITLTDYSEYLDTLHEYLGQFDYTVGEVTIRKAD